MLDVQSTLRAEDGKLFEVAEQEFDPSYLSGLRWARHESRSRPTGDMHRVASVPAIFVHKALKEGFNFYRAPVKEIVTWLRKNDLTDFITTEKRV